jgi:alanyl-tRNA synthetase
LEEIASRVEAEELLSEALKSVPPAVAGGSSDIKIITKVFDNRDADSLKHLALALIAHNGVIALLGSRDQGTARLIFARSADASGDMNALMRQACEMLDGRGGGKPDMAQGGGKNVESLEETIHIIQQGLKSEFP